MLFLLYWPAGPKDTRPALVVFVNVPAMRHPETCIGHADKLFDEQGNFINDATCKFLHGSCSPVRPGSPPAGVHKRIAIMVPLVC
jgi:hypothetical protein